MKVSAGFTLRNRGTIKVNHSGFLFQRKIVPEQSSGFTLIELLVVISIMAIIGVYTFSNYSSFGEDKKLDSAILDVQSQLRTAQSNAKSNVACSGQFSKNWQVEFASANTVNLKCSASATPQKVLPLDTKYQTITIQAISTKTISGTDCLPVAVPPFVSPFPTVSIAPVTGKMDLGGATCTSLTITLLNSKTAHTKDLKIEQGGRIYVPQ